MAIEGTPDTEETKMTPVTPEETEKVEKTEPEPEKATESDDEDFAADTQELEDAAESSDDESGDEEMASQDDVVEEDYMVEVKNGQIHKMKFSVEANSQEAESQEDESKLEMLSKTLPENDDEDGDYNPCHDTLSDVEVDEEEDESQPHTVKKLEALHKRTGAPLTEIEINTDEVKIPPADFVAKVTLTAEGDNDENAMEE